MSDFAALLLAAAVAFFGVCIATLGAEDRYEVVPTPRGTIVLDKLKGEARQLEPLPMFQTRE